MDSKIIVLSVMFIALVSVVFAANLFIEPPNLKNPSAKPIGLETDELEIVTNYASGAPVNLLSAFKDFSGKTDLTEASLASLMTFYTESGSKISASISVSDNKIVLVLNKGSIVADTNYWLKVNLPNKANTDTLKLEVFNVKKVTQLADNGDGTYGADAEVVTEVA